MARANERGDRSGRGASSSGGRHDGGRDRRPVSADGDLPKWVREEINRSTPKDRRQPALTHLGKAVGEFADERYGAAFEQLSRAKDLAPQAATIRELLGLSAYHLERWQKALKELRAFRRMSGETTQMPVEMDCLRALGRPEEIEKTWRSMKDLPTDAATEDEARVVYASSLLDRDLMGDAWRVIKPGRLVENPRPSALRRWFVAARVAHAAGDTDAARRLVDAIAKQDADFPGLVELRAELDG